MEAEAEVGVEVEIAQPVLVDVAVTEAATEIEHRFPRVNGVDFTDLPDDLYIPPDALEVFLDAFEGPLDLLLYLIRKNNMDILDIPVAQITHQYMEYVELMKDLHLELAADYLVMAAMLAEIKSRMLLPRVETPEGEEIDPRADLIRRLQEYERFKHAAEQIERLPRMHRDIFTNAITVPTVELPLTRPPIDLSELLGAFLVVLKRSDLMATHKVERETLSIRERMSIILERISEARFIAFSDCFTLEEGRIGVVVSFIATLELLRLGLIDIVQAVPFGPIHLKVVVQDESPNQSEE